MKAYFQGQKPKLPCLPCGKFDVKRVSGGVYAIFFIWKAGTMFFDTWKMAQKNNPQHRWWCSGYFCTRVKMSMLANLSSGTKMSLNWNWTKVIYWRTVLWTLAMISWKMQALDSYVLPLAKFIIGLNCPEIPAPMRAVKGSKYSPFSGGEDILLYGKTRSVIFNCDSERKAEKVKS